MLLHLRQLTHWKANSMKLYDHHWISKGCTVEILYGEHRTFRVQKIFKVLGIDSNTPQDKHGRNTLIVDVYGEHLHFLDTSLKLIDKPGYTRVKDGKWIPNYMVE